MTYFFGADSLCSFQGREGVSSRFCLCKAPPRRVISLPCSGLQFMTTQGRNRRLDSLVLPASQLLCLGTLLHQGTTCSLRDPRGPQTMLSHLGFCLTLHLSTSKQGTSPCSRPLKVPILCSAAYTWCSPPQAAPPPYPELYHNGVKSPHLLHSKLWWLFYRQTCRISFLISLIDFSSVHNDLVTFSYTQGTRQT